MNGRSSLKMFTIYIAKAAANYGLTATRPIYERALEALSDRQTAKMCLRFAALERKLGEIDRARAIYAHASQFCDPRTNPEFWTEWHSFEIDTGSEDTFREMLRIKRSVQAQFNTESSYLAAQALAASQGAAMDAEEEDALDPMAAAEKQSGGLKFVSAKQQAPHKDDGEQAPSPQAVGNADEIQISDEEDI
jgi:pre-mRNA-splicing factor SYF1